MQQDFIGLEAEIGRVTSNVFGLVSPPDEEGIDSSRMKNTLCPQLRSELVLSPLGLQP